jgi:hypothetical protein
MVLWWQSKEAEHHEFVDRPCDSNAVDNIKGRRGIGLACTHQRSTSMNVGCINGSSTIVALCQCGRDHI